MGMVCRVADLYIPVDDVDGFQRLPLVVVAVQGGVMLSMGLFKTESIYDDSLRQYRINADQIMVKMNVFLTCVCFVIAPHRDTWDAALLLGLPTLWLSDQLAKKRPGALITRLYMACAFMMYTSIIIHQSGGDIEAHFSAFGLIGILLYYRDWRTILVATVFIYLQHLVVGFGQTLGLPIYVFDTADFWSVFALHVAYFLPFVAMMGYLSVWLRREGFEQNRIIHESHQRELALREMMDKAEVANRVKSEILANMSHEIRTPLNGVGGMIQLALDSDLNKHQRELLETAKHSSEYLLSVINNILDYSKIESGALDITSTPTDVVDLLGTVRLFFEPSAREKGLDLCTDFEGVQAQYLLLDAVLLRQILTNLIGNAIKFTHQGFVKVSLQTPACHPTSPVILRIQIEDSGIGFDPALTETLFSPFIQADSTLSRGYGGTGLGLSITRSLVHKMGGEISCQSAPGAGSIFTVTLPCSLADPLIQDPPDKAPPTPPSAATPLTVLLAEDHPVNQKLMVLMLTKLGHQVTVAENGKEALAHLALRPFDFILLDAMMPVMDGLEMLTALRDKEAKEGGHCPVIMVTAHAMTGDKEKYLLAGADGYLSKPVSVQSLQAVMAQVLGVAA